MLSVPRLSLICSPGVHADLLECHRAFCRNPGGFLGSSSTFLILSLIGASQRRGLLNVLTMAIGKGGDSNSSFYIY